MQLELAKIHGCHNDYLFVDCTRAPLENPGELSRRLSPRRGGIGADGLILVCPSEKADFRMEMYNADGSRGAMCGNGIRGLAKFVYERGLAGTSNSLLVETDCGNKALELHVTDGKVESVTVDMGPPVLEGRQVPVNADGEQFDVPLLVDGRNWTVSCVSMGNPHCVTFDEDPEDLDLERIGPAFDSHEFFPSGVNTEFARVDNRGQLTMRVWERGSGETEACGTGACAVVVAAHRTGRCDSNATVVLKGGQLYIELRGDGRVFMTGPVEESFSGTVSVPG